MLSPGSTDSSHSRPPFPPYTSLLHPRCPCKLLPCRFISLTGKLEVKASCESSSVILFRSKFSFSPQYPQRPFLIVSNGEGHLPVIVLARSPVPPTSVEHLHPSSSPSRHYFPHHRTHHMMKSAIVGKEVETPAVHQRSQVDQLALKHSADLNNRVSFDGSPLHWHRVTHQAASASPGYSSIMARIPTHWIPLETPHRIKRHITDR